MREIQAAASGEQKLAGGGGHLFANDHPIAKARQVVGRDETRRACADYHDIQGGLVQ